MKLLTKIHLLIVCVKVFIKQNYLTSFGVGGYLCFTVLKITDEGIYYYILMLVSDLR